MLVLTRKLKEQIVIGDDLLVISVVGLSSGRVRLGIDAPTDVAIRRHEFSDEAARPDAETQLLHG